MDRIRTILTGHSALWLLLIAAALFARAAIPAGYMPSQTRTLTVMLCADQSAEALTISIPMEQQDGHKNRHASDSDCGFGSLAGAPLGAADAVLVAGNIRHAVLLGFAAVATPALPATANLRPPLRGPPVIS